MTNAYEYVIKNPGVDTEASYPYEEKQSRCRFDPANVGSECIAYMEIQIGNEEALKQAVATVGPVAAGIDGAQRSFQFYKSGFYFEPKCDTVIKAEILRANKLQRANNQKFFVTYALIFSKGSESRSRHCRLWKDRERRRILAV